MNLLSPLSFILKMEAAGLFEMLAPIYEMTRVPLHKKIIWYIDLLITGTDDFYIFQHAHIFHSSVVCFITQSVNMHRFDSQVINFWKTK
jgi:hypothetical protein